jgi:hypothetical protein
MATRDVPIVITDLSGGQNSADSPLALAANQATSVSNVEFFRTKVGRKRRGSRLVERDAGSVWPTTKKFSTVAMVTRLSDTAIGVVIEASDLSAWYAWGYGIPATDFSTASVLDTPSTNACVVYFNGKWFAAYKSTVDRLHTIGVNAASGYRVGIAAPAAPTITETAGAVTDNRKYRYVLYNDSAVGARSEPGTETGVRTLVAERATAGAPLLGGVPPELYTHWQLQVASDDDNYATWWVVGTAAATVDIVDNNASILALTPALELGLFEVPHSAKYLGVDGNRLLMAGAYENATVEALQQRVWFTPVLGDLGYLGNGYGDDERIPDTLSGQHNWVDIDAGDNGGAITGFGPSTLGDVLVFKRTQVWRLVRTGNVAAPYIPRAISKAVGTFGYRTVCAGQDGAGNPCVYFASARGPMRVGVNGVEYLGAAIEDVWAAVDQRGNAHISQHAVYYTDRGQYWLWVSINGDAVPSVLLIYTVASGGWARYTGPLATALCSALMPRFIQEDNKGVTASVALQSYVPYCCPSTNGQMAECDAINPQTLVLLDTDLETYSGSGSVWTDGTAFQASITTRPLPGKEPDSTLSVNTAHVVADATSGITVQLSLVRDYGAETRAFTTLLTPVGTETIATKRFDSAELANARALQVTIGDASALASNWRLHALMFRITEEYGR